MRFLVPILCILYLLSPENLFAQRRSPFPPHPHRSHRMQVTPDREPSNDPWLKNELQHRGTLLLKINTLNFLDASGALLPVAVEYGFSRRFSLQAEVGLPLFYRVGIFNGHNNGHKTIYSDFRLRLNGRFNFKYNGPVRGFVALDGWYRNQRAHISNEGANFETYFEYGYQQYYYKSADVLNHEFGVNALIGFQAFFSKRWMFELFAGLGAKFCDGRYSNIVSPARGQDNKFGQGFFSLNPRTNGTSGVLNMPLGMSFGYRLK